MIYMLPLSYNFNIKLWKFFFTSKSPENMFCLGLLFERRVPGWERYRMTRLLSEVSEKKRQPIPTVVCMQIRCDIKGSVRDILPARHSLSDRRINSSHGNSFIFPRSKSPFPPSQFAGGVEWRGVGGGGGERRIFPRPSLYFLLLVWLWKKEHTGKWASQIFCPATHRQAFKLP